MKTFFALVGYISLMLVLSYQAFGPVDLQVYSAVPTQVELDGKSLYKLPKYDESQEILCLMENIYHEARSQSIDGMVAVASVTVNRMNHVNYPDSLCEVVYDPYQFSWVNEGAQLNIDNSIDRHAWETIRGIALRVLNEGVPNDMMGVYHYHADYVEPEWALAKVKYKQIDNHIFYKMVI